MLAMPYLWLVKYSQNVPALYIVPLGFSCIGSTFSSAPTMLLHKKYHEGENFREFCGFKTVKTSFPHKCLGAD